MDFLVSLYDSTWSIARSSGLAPVFTSALDLLFPPRDGEKVVRGTTPESLRALLAPKLVERDGFAATALVPFRTIVRPLVHEAKYRGNARAQALLGGLLAGYLSDSPPAAEAIAFIPVPLSRTRRAERGFNQCDAIARNGFRILPAHARANLSYDPSLLVRVRDTEHQTSLTRAGRRANLDGAFRASRPLDPRILYIVFDDVLTTGSTLRAASAALAEAGANRIFPLAIAH